MYTLGILPLIKKADHLKKRFGMHYADDASALVSLVNLHRWWDMIDSLDPTYGYYANFTKIWLLVKESS